MAGWRCASFFALNRRLASVTSRVRRLSCSCDCLSSIYQTPLARQNNLNLSVMSSLMLMRLRQVGLACSGRVKPSRSEPFRVKISLTFLRTVDPKTLQKAPFYKQTGWRRGSKSNIKLCPFQTVTTPSSISLCARSSMFSTLSQRFPDFKNYSAVL